MDLIDIESIPHLETCRNISYVVVSLKTPSLYNVSNLYNIQVPRIYPEQVESMFTRIYMMVSLNGNIFRVSGHLCEEFTGDRPVTRNFDVFFDLRLNKRLSKQWRS